jgi:SAM-dependent methyltransferase
MRKCNGIELEPTKNLHGHMHQLSYIGQKFIDFAANASLPVLDIGCAYGVSSIPCLRQGTKVVACDMNQEHLDELEERTPEACREFLTKHLARFPNETHFPENSFSAIILSHVLSFLEKDELILGFNDLHRWLCPGGRLFILNYTPFHRKLTDFIPVYEQRLKESPTFAGEIQDVRMYSPDKLPFENLPHRLLCLDKPTMRFLLDENKFTIDYLEYIGGKDAGVPEDIQLDGNEWIGCIVTKK